MHVQLACWTDPRSDLENVLLMVPPVAIVDAVSVAELGAENRAFSSWAPRRYSFRLVCVFSVFLLFMILAQWSC